MALWQSLPEIEKGRKKRRLDALGLTAFAFMMASFLLFVDSAGKEDGVDNPIALAFGAAFVAFAIAFVLTEIYWTKGPMIPLSLFSKGQVGPYFAVQMLLLIAQFTVGQETANMDDAYPRCSWYLISQFTSRARRTRPIPSPLCISCQLRSATRSALWWLARSLIGTCCLCDFDMILNRPDIRLCAGPDSTKSSRSQQQAYALRVLSR